MIISLYLLYIFINAAVFCSKSSHEQNLLTSELGGMTFFYFTIPAFSILYHMVVSNKGNVISKLYHKLTKSIKADRLLKENEDITIQAVQVKIVNKLNYITHELEEIKTVHVKYRYNHDKLHDLIGYQYELVENNIADIFIENKDKQVTMKESEFRIMILNNRLDSLQRI